MSIGGSNDRKKSLIAWKYLFNRYSKNLSSLREKENKLAITNAGQHAI